MNRYEIAIGKKPKKNRQKNGQKILSEIAKKVDPLGTKLLELRAVLNPTDKESKKLEELVEELSHRTALTVTQITEAFLQMGKLGVQTDKFLEL